jgi:hypothetical protein
MSINNIFLTAGEPFVRYTKTVNHGITGFRLNPDDNDRKIEFQLITFGPHPPYEDAVLELYSDKEVKFFRQANRYLFQAGLIREYEGEAPAVDMSNVLDEDEILEIASTRNIQQLEKRIQAITSKITMRRIYEVAQEIGRPAKTLALLEQHLAQL